MTPPECYWPPELLARALPERYGHLLSKESAQGHGVSGLYRRAGIRALQRHPAPVWYGGATSGAEGVKGDGLSWLVVMAPLGVIAFAVVVFWAVSRQGEP